MTAAAQAKASAPGGFENGVPIPPAWLKMRAFGPFVPSIDEHRRHGSLAASCVASGLSDSLDEPITIKVGRGVDVNRRQITEPRAPIKLREGAAKDGLAAAVLLHEPISAYRRIFQITFEFLLKNDGFSAPFTRNS
jgi:hypothetical protein